MPRKSTVPKKPAEVMAADPLKPYTEITIDGQVYRMCFTYRALAAAEDALNSKGYAVSALGGMIKRNFSTVRVLFALSLFAYHPDLDFEAAQDWVTPFNISDVLNAMEKAWLGSMADAKPSDPPPPAQ